MPRRPCRYFLLASLMIGPAVFAQDEPEPAVPAETQSEDQSQAEPGDERRPRAKSPSARPPPEQRGADPLTERERPPSEPTLPPETIEQEPMVLGVPESELKIDPRTLGIAPGEPMPKLLREGEFIRNRDARLIPTGERGHAVVILDPPADAAPDAKRTAMIVAPNRMLESMESLQKDRGDDLRFTVTGQVHTYRGVNYPMVTSQPRPWLTGRAEPEPELAEDQDGESPAEPPAEETDATDATDDEDSSDEVLDQLLGQRTDSPTDLEPAEPDDDQTTPPALDPRPLVQGVAPDQPEPKLYEEGAFIIDRSARLIRSGDGAHPVLIFDADDAETPEPPMIVQNCKLLEEMEAIIEVHGDHVPFVVTGQVQIYRGTNYLLPSIAKLEFERNNLE